MRERSGRERREREVGEKKERERRERAILTPHAKYELLSPNLFTLLAPKMSM